MHIQNSVKRGRGRGLVALVGAVIAAPACFLPVPPVDEDPSTSSASSSGGASTDEVPTTGGESTSTGDATSTGVADTTSSSTSEAGESSTGTTEFSLPTCPYDPPGAVVTLAAGAEGDMSLQACGTNKQFTRLKLMQSTGTALPFAACSDDACSECADDMAVDLDVAVPDPFSVFGAGVVEGGCYALDMKWERPTVGDPAVCQPSTPASHFHLLRTHAYVNWHRPVVIATPKSMLRSKLAVSQPDDFISDKWRPAQGDPTITDPSAVERIILCSGKIRWELVSARTRLGLDGKVAILSLERLYPLPADELAAELAKYPHVTDIRFAQDEPENQGAWQFMQLHLPQAMAERLPGRGFEMRPFTRPAASAPSVGSHKLHQQQEEALLTAALTQE